MTSIDLNSIPPPNLNGRALEGSLKRKLVEEVHVDGSSYILVMEKYNLKYDALRKYYKRVTRHMPTFEFGGRPTKLDLEGQEKVENYLHLHGTTDKADLYPIVRSEMAATLARRYPQGIPASVSRKIAKSSVRRWAQVIITKHYDLERIASSIEGVCVIY